MSVAITNVDSFYINIAETNGVNVNARKFTVEFGAISGDELPVYFDKRPVSKGRGLIVLDYTTTTVEGLSPSSAEELQFLIERLLLMAEVTIGDSANLDAFSRLRVSNPVNLFSTQCQYNADPIQMETGSTGDGSAPSHSANDRMVALSSAAGTGTSFIQSYQYIPYQPSKSQFIAVTGVLGTAVANAVVDVGYFDDKNGIFYRQNGTSGLQFVRRTSTSGSPVDNTVDQADWNIDKMDGTGISGVTLDEDNCFILIIDLQFLAMGRIRVGFDVDGIIYYAHEFLNANVLTLPYMQTATLPIQMLLTTTATASEKTCYFKCAAVNSEGGFESDLGQLIATDDKTVTAGNGTQTHLMTIRPKTTFNGIENRSLFILNDVDILVTGNSPIFWELFVGVSLATPSFADINSTYSAFEVDTTGTPTLTNAVRIDSGYIPSSAQSKGQVSARNAGKYPISLDRAGAVRNFGQLTLIVTGIGGTSATRASISFNELR